MSKNTFNIISIIQARMGSVRLPGKIMKPLCGKPILEHILERVQASHLIEKTVVATTKTAQDDLDFFARNNERDTLEERLRLLQTEQSPISLPSRESALLFRDDILSYVAEQQLALTQYANDESLTPFGDREYPTIRYSLIAQGDEAALVGMLSLLQDLPTASVQVLQLIRPPEELADWELSLELTLFFSNGGTQVSQ